MWKISGWAFPHYGRSSSKAELALFISSQSDTWLHLGFSLIIAEVWSVRLKRLHAFHPQGLLCFNGSGQRYGSKHFKLLMFNTFKAEVLENTKLTLWMSEIGASWIFRCFKEYGVLLLLAVEGWNKTRTYFSQTLLFFTEWSWQSLFSCILKGCQDELHYTNMSV